MEIAMMVLLLLAAVTTHAKPTQKPSCIHQGMAKFNITLDTFWTEENFPKQFPTFRPHAQWAKMIGRTHSPKYALWEEGEMSGKGVMEYVEKGSTELLDQEVQGMDGILDIFNTRSLDLGIGSTSVNVLADPYHSKVSVMARLVPSPDWFVGVSSLELCKHGQWLDTLTRDLNLYDAGTDQGFTFTAPNWPEVPYKPISQITSKLPNHPANSFFYPELSALPTIATLTIQRVETITNDKPDSFTPKAKLPNEPNTLNDDSSSGGRRHPKAYQPDEPVVFNPVPASHLEAHNPREPKQRITNQVDEKKPVEFSLFRTEMRPRSYTSPAQEPTPAPQELKRTTAPEVKKTSPPEIRRTSPHAHIPQSCEVSEWAEWSACSKSCGYGTRTRSRTVLVEAENGGAPCPVMKEEELCGSMRSCRWNHFGTTFGQRGGSVGAGSRARSGASTGRRRSVLFRRRKQQKKRQQASDSDEN